MIFREIYDTVLKSNAINDIKKRLLQDIRHKKDSANNIFAYCDGSKAFLFEN